MKQFMTVCLIAALCVIMFFGYIKLVGKVVPKQPRIDSTKTMERIREENMRTEQLLREQKYSNENVRERQKRLAEERKRKLEDFQRRY